MTLAEMLIRTVRFQASKPKSTKAKATPERLAELRAQSAEVLRALNKDQKFIEARQRMREEKKEMYSAMMKKMRQDPEINKRRYEAMMAAFRARKSA